MNRKKRSYSTKIIGKLYSKAGNICSMYGCNQELFPDYSEVNMSEIAHIHTLNKPENSSCAAAMRYDSSLSQAELNSYDNLILLCPTHHKIIDDDTTGTYTVEYLKKMKADHERAVAEELRQSVITPPLDYQKFVLPGLIDSIYDIAPFRIVDISEDEVKHIIEEVMNFSKKTRFVLYNIIRGTKTDGSFRVSAILDNDQLSMKERIDSCQSLEAHEYIQEVKFTGNPDFTDPITGAIIDYSGNQVLKYNDGDWDFCRKGLVIYGVYNCLGKNADKFYNYLIEQKTPDDIE